MIVDCQINKSQIKSLDFVFNSVFRKIFLIKSYDVASECITFFDCSVSDAICRRKLKFLILIFKILKFLFFYSTRKTLYANCLKKVLLTNWILCTDICLVKLFKFFVCCIIFHIYHVLVNKDDDCCRWTSHWCGRLWHNHGIRTTSMHKTMTL